MPSKKTGSAASSIGLTIDDGICLESRVADSFNDFFTIIASKLVKELPSGIDKFTSSFFTNFYKSKHTKNVTSFFLSKPCHIDKLRLVKYADEFLTTLQSGLSKTSQKVVKYVSHNALLNSERGSNGGQRC